jgi:hypothetical protein
VKAMFFMVFVAAFLATLQTTLASSLTLGLSRIPGLEFVEGHTVDFALILLVYLVFHRDFLGSLLWAAIFGILAGSFGMGWRGATALSYFSVAVAGSFVKRHVLVERWPAVALLVAAFTLFEGLIHLEAGHLFAAIPDPVSRQWGILGTQMLLNGLAAPPLFSILYFFDGIVGGRSTRERRSLLLDT